MFHEACVILKAQLTDQEIQNQVEKLKQILVSGGAEIGKVSLWGKRKLAHAIGKELDGFYVIMQFKLAKVGETLVGFERSARYDDNVLRTMIVTVPEKKKGMEVKSIVPEPGWLADFNMKLRAMAPRRRFDRDDRGPRRYEDSPPRDAAPAAAAEAAPAEAPAAAE